MGRAARSRWSYSEVISGLLGSRGTLKSARSSTVLPATSKSWRLAMFMRVISLWPGLSVGLARLHEMTGEVK